MVVELFYVTKSSHKLIVFIIILATIVQMNETSQVKGIYTMLQMMMIWEIHITDLIWVIKLRHYNDN